MYLSSAEVDMRKLEDEHEHAGLEFEDARVVSFLLGGDVIACNAKQAPP